MMTLALSIIVVIMGILYISNKATYTSMRKEVMDEIKLTNIVKVSLGDIQTIKKRSLRIREASSRC